MKKTGFRFKGYTRIPSRHFHLLKQTYGNIVIVNLLGSKMGEKTLSDAYRVF